MDFLYDESGEIYSVIYNGTQYYYVRNLQGDVVQIRSIYGTAVVEYTYDAWGNVLSITGQYANTLGALNPIRYRGYFYDFETGFYYLQSRYYDPVIRRFISADDPELLGATGSFLSYNLYAYCENNPVNYSDPSGYFYISNKQLTNILHTVLLISAFNPVGTALVAIGAYKLYTFIVAKATLLGAKIGAAGGPIAAGIVSVLFGLVVGISGWTIVEALIQGKGISITWKKTFWGIPYGLDMSIE